MIYYVYFLQSIKDKKFYIGFTSRNPAQRLDEHNSGKVTSTRNRIPFRLVYQEEYCDRKEAYKREWHLKHPKGYLDKIKIINNLGPVAQW